MTFISKYKPSLFNDYEADKAPIITTLKMLIDINTINILFIGNANTGKSILLESIIKEYNIKYNQSSNNHVLRLNNIKEQGIQYFRNDLRCFCQNIASSKVKKLVIVDDVDLITEQAQQVLANCIEKYSDSTNFLLSCTNTHKVINQVQASLLTLLIPTISTELKQNLFMKVINTENISLTQESQILFLTLTSNIKNMLNNLEKCSLYTSEIIDVDTLTSLICNIHSITFDNFSRCLKNGDLLHASEILLDLYHSGYSVIDILDNYFAYVSKTNMYNDEDKYQIVKTITHFTAIFHMIHEDALELPIFVNSLITILTR